MVMVMMMMMMMMVVVKMAAFDGGGCRVVGYSQPLYSCSYIAGACPFIPRIPLPRYDVYVSGLRGTSAVTADASSTELTNAEGTGADGQLERRRIGNCTLFYFDTLHRTLVHGILANVMLIYSIRAHNIVVYSIRSVLLCSA